MMAHEELLWHNGDSSSKLRRGCSHFHIALITLEIYTVWNDKIVALEKTT